MRSGFFNSEIIGYDAENMPVFDRAEEASFFAKYFSQFISNGVFPNPSTNMQVLATTGMNVKVDIGTCYINGYMGWVEPAETFEIEESDLQARIDRVVARLDFTDRSIKLYVKKGTPLGNPVAPELQRDYGIYEIGLADIRVNANAITITQENITDLRLNTELCGIVANQLQHVDTTTLFNQYQTWLNRVTGEAETNLNNIQTEFEQSFNTWFQTIQNVLDGDTAGNLLNRINANTQSINANTQKINDNIPTYYTLTLLTTGWVLNETTGKYEYDVEDESITEDHLIRTAMTIEEQSKLSDADGESYNGGFIIRTTELPEENITMDIIIQKLNKKVVAPPETPAEGGDTNENGN